MQLEYFLELLVLNHVFQLHKKLKYQFFLNLELLNKYNFFIFISKFKYFFIHLYGGSLEAISHNIMPKLKTSAFSV